MVTHNQMQFLKPLWNWSFRKRQDFVNIPLKYYFPPVLINTFFKGTKTELYIINECCSNLKREVRFKSKRKKSQKSNWAQVISHSTPKMKNGECLHIATFITPPDCIIYVQDKTNFATLKNGFFFTSFREGNFLRWHNPPFLF